MEATKKDFSGFHRLNITERLQRVAEEFGLSSTASRLPVEAPEGTAALPIEPSDKTTTACIVGLPRESITSRPVTLAILTLTAFSPQSTK